MLDDGEAKALSLGVAGARFVFVASIVARGDVGEVFFRDARAIVEDFAFKVAIHHIEDDADVFAVVIVLHGILNEVGNRLFEQRRIGGDFDGVGWCGPVEFQLFLCGKWGVASADAFDDLAEVEGVELDVFLARFHFCGGGHVGDQ